MNTADLIDALLNPETYPHPVDLITTIETHISIVFLTGPYAYKLKKPVDFGFLNFSTIQLRKKFCELELTLNRRTAPQLYLGIDKIVKQGSNIHLTPLTKGKSSNDKSSQDSSHSVNEDTVDYLVKMKQFNPNDVLGRMLGESSLNEDMISALTEQIANFHKMAQPVELNTEYGEPKIQLQPMLDNFPSLSQYFSDSATQQKLTSLLAWTNQEFSIHKQNLKERKQNGFVKACHGDLHLDNITLIDNQPVLFDGIEFNEYFRWIDVMSDLAFLLIDLDFRKQFATSYKILSQYLTQTLDYKGLYLLNFYRVYRTMVRAKITALRAEQLPLNSLEQKCIEQTALSYIDQAIGYTQPNNNVPKQKPKCILLQGVSGSGKSYFANQLLDELGDFKAIILSSDRIRKTLFGIDAHHRVSEEEKQQLYSNEMNRKTYKALADNAKICMDLGFNVILDATFLKRHHRETIHQVAKTCSADYFVFSLLSTIETAKQSINLRQKLNNNPSDATINVMLNQLKQVEEPRADENALLININELRQRFPKESIQEFLNLPIK
ncbi:AAA family ATPase [Thiomicrorhabdus sp. Milos-T2]|uniref:bifunctional aminoglycoside phosphotransferase/ATP-binding protein n=1 Tax=Thiomicrorhabdus sp. Milos-T2 TaxID=90814 RepID=UPI000493DA0D|nr:AAA family ATPase [Thiomicrorhabdus sp. Milos-T2]